MTRFRVRQRAWRPFARRLVGFLSLLWVSACWLPHKKAAAATHSSAPSIEVPETEFAIRVTNHNYMDVIVFVLHHGLHTRVGTVTGSSVSTFYLPARLLSQGGEIQLYGDPVGNDEFALTELLIVRPGQYIEWTLESDLKRSSVAVF